MLKSLQKSLECPLKSWDVFDYVLLVKNNAPLHKVCIYLKWYYDQKIISFFPSDFESVFV